MRGQRFSQIHLVIPRRPPEGGPVRTARAPCGALVRLAPVAIEKQVFVVEGGVLGQKGRYPSDVFIFRGEVTLGTHRNLVTGDGAGPRRRKNFKSGKTLFTKAGPQKVHSLSRRILGPDNIAMGTSMS